MAVNPTTNIGFALYGMPGPGKGSVLQMLDLAKGTMLPSIKGRYGSFGLALDNVNPVGGFALAVHMSPDGRYLFTGHRASHRFRVEGEDLVHEQSRVDS